MCQALNGIKKDEPLYDIKFATSKKWNYVETATKKLLKIEKRRKSIS